MKKFMSLLMGFVVLAGSTVCFANQTIVAGKVVRPPVIDGIGSDSPWAQAREYTIYDSVEKINMTVKAVYTDSEIFFLVSYPDPDQSNTHKSWLWDKTTKMYKPGPDREDTFVFKWNMELHNVDLSLKADNDYMADIWFWKACRTNPVGYADDKYHRYSASKMEKSTKVTSKSGRTMYLVRKGDGGTSAYKRNLHVDYKGDRVPAYGNRTPTGSRGDIRAKGMWSGGRWTIEFSRALNTGNGDDIQLDPSKTYLFGVSRHEIAGRKPGPGANQSLLYGAGDVGEPLTLRFGG